MLNIIIGCVLFFIMTTCYCLYSYIYSAKENYNAKFKSDIDDIRNDIAVNLRYISGYTGSGQNMLMVLHRLKHIDFVEKNFNFLYSIFQYSEIPITADPVKVVFKLEEIANSAEQMYLNIGYPRERNTLLEKSANHPKKEAILKELEAADNLQGLEAKIKELVRLSYKYDLFGD